MSESSPAAVDESAATAADPSSAALARYARSIHRQRLVYAAVITAVVAALIAWAAVAWSRGEAANTTLRTVVTPPPTLRVQAPNAKLRASWHVADRAALGMPRWSGTVVTYSTHRVRGVDARTGAQTWSYTRSNRTVCTAIQAAGTTIAVYQVNGNCDEVTALDSDTGARRWTRTLDMDGMPVNGHPAYQVRDDTVLVTTPTVIYALDPVSGYDRWEYTRPGCTIGHVVLGSAGALISQTCTKPTCATQKFCGSGPQLLLRDGFQGHDDKSKTNPDQIKWNTIGNTDVPVSADEVISALNTTTRALDLLDDRGKAAGEVTLRPTPSSSNGIGAISLPGRREVVRIDGVTYAIEARRDTARWRARTVGLLTPTDPDQLSPRTGLSLASADGIELVDDGTGKVTRKFSVPPPAAGSRVYALGTGFLVCGPRGTVAYR